MLVPEVRTIIRVKLACEGIQHSRILAIKFTDWLKDRKENGQKLP